MTLSTRRDASTAGSKFAAATRPGQRAQEGRRIAWAMRALQARVLRPLIDRALAAGERRRAASEQVRTTGARGR